MSGASKFRNVVSLIPGGCLQFLDFAFDVAAVAKMVRAFAEQEKGTDPETGEMQYNLHCLDLDPERQIYFDRSSLVEKDKDYDINAVRALEPFLHQWIPLPYFRRTGQTRQGEPQFAKGPTNWCRAFVEPLAAPDESGITHRVTIAFDTTIEEPIADEYGAITTQDVESGEEFLLARRERDMAWWMNEPWLDEWVYQSFYEMKLAARKGRPLRDEDFPVACEHLARYITFVDVLGAAIDPPRVRLIDPARFAPIDVDLILDIGNSRSCGILVESLPDAPTDLNNSYVLELRDLSLPTRCYREPFSSQIAFSRPSFGRAQLSKRSGRRSEAFDWPSSVRVGPEARRLAGHSLGAEGPTGMSSPKRYLWDERPRLQEWRYVGTSVDGRVSEPPVTSGLFVQHLNEAGTPIGRIKDPAIRGNPAFRGQTADPAFNARYSRSSLLMFALGEIVAQALVDMNAPSRRCDRPQSDVPRRLRRIVLTMPTAMPLAELKIFRRWANWAIYVLWQALGWSAFYSDARDPRRQQRRADYRLNPDVRAEFDEASATQLVYLFNQISDKYQGDVRYFFRMMGKKRGSIGGGASECLRVASIDIGGGTTDLIISTYEALGSGAAAAIKPTQNFREGFKIAGDDILAAVIERHVLRPILLALQAAGVPDAKALMTRLFGGDYGGQSENDRALRRRFASEVAVPIGLAMLRHLEDEPPFSETILTRGFDEFFADGPTPAHVVAYLEGAAAKAGAPGFRLSDLKFELRAQALDETVKRVIGQMMADLAEVIHFYDCDVVLLSGRPSRLPTVTSIMYARIPVPPDRIQPMHLFRIGDWYPFRSPRSLIDDPKTTAAVGAMLCTLAEGQLPNFALQTNRFRLRSTARYIGELELSGQLRADKVFLSELDVDAREEVERTCKLEFYAPVFIGFRQLPIERWGATPFYRLAFRDQVAIANARNRLPYQVVLTYRLTPPEEDAGRNDGEADEGEFIIEAIESSDGFPVNNGDLELRLQTLKSEDGYWIDTGVFTVV